MKQIVRIIRFRRNVLWLQIISYNYRVLSITMVNIASIYHGAFFLFLFFPLKRGSLELKR